MQVYSCTVRLGGLIANEVPMASVTAPEIIILRHEHGDDAVVKIRQIHSDRRHHAAERDRLGRLYGDRKVLELFGPPHRELPVKLEQGDLERFGIDTEVSNATPAAADADVMAELEALRAERDALRADLEEATQPQGKGGKRAAG